LQEGTYAKIEQDKPQLLEGASPSRLVVQGEAWKQTKIKWNFSSANEKVYEIQNRNKFKFN